MARINLDEIREDEEIRNKAYVWKKPLILNVNKGRRATDADITVNEDRRLGIDRREYQYDAHVPERRLISGGGRRKNRRR